MIKKKGERVLPAFVDNIRRLTKIGILRKLPRDEEVKAIESLFRMLSHYGSHPEFVSENIATFLYVWTISTLSFLLKRYQETLNTNT